MPYGYENLKSLRYFSLLLNMIMPVVLNYPPLLIIL